MGKQADVNRQRRWRRVGLETVKSRTEVERLMSHQNKVTDMRCKGRNSTRIVYTRQQGTVGPGT